MKVYVAIEVIEYMGDKILGIFYTEEAAEKRCDDEFTLKCDFKVEEYELEKGYFYKRP